MAKCIKLTRTKTEVCIGSLNRMVDIYTRDITTPSKPFSTDVDITETFSLTYSVWSMFETPNGYTIFDDVNEKSTTVTDNIYIRYIADLTAESYIIFNSNRYDIINVSNIERNSIFQKLECTILGADDKEAAEA